METKYYMLLERIEYNETYDILKVVEVISSLDANEIVNHNEKKYYTSKYALENNESCLYQIVSNDTINQFGGIENFSENMKNSRQVVLLDKKLGEFIISSIPGNESINEDEYLYHYDITNEIKKIVHFQNEAIEKLSTLFCMAQNQNFESNIIINGEKSVGKKTVIKQLCEVFNIPVIFIDLDYLNYLDISKYEGVYIYYNLLVEANFQKELSENGVIVLENISSIKNNLPVLEKLISIMQKKDFRIEYNESIYVLNNTKIKFIGLDNINYTNCIGITPEKNALIDLNNLEAMGYYQKFIDKFNYVLNFNSLSISEKESILRSRELGPLSTYYLAFEEFNITLKVKEIAIKKIVGNIEKKNLNMLEITKYIDRLFLDAMTAYYVNPTINTIIVEDLIDNINEIDYLVIKTQKKVERKREKYENS